MSAGFKMGWLGCESPTRSENTKTRGGVQCVISRCRYSLAVSCRFDMVIYPGRGECSESLANKWTQTDQVPEYIVIVLRMHGHHTAVSPAADQTA